MLRRELICYSRKELEKMLDQEGCIALPAVKARVPPIPVKAAPPFTICAM